MNQAFTAAIGAAQLASNFNVPFIGAAASTVQAIQQACQKVAVHRAECQLLADKSGRLLEVLSERTSTLDDANLRVAADEIQGVLEAVRGRVVKWSQYNRVQAFLRDGKIEDGIRKCQSDLDAAITKFSIASTFIMHQQQYNIYQMMQSNHEEWRSSVSSQGQELRSLLLEIFRSPHEMEYAEQMHREGRPAAERLMEEGQRYLAEQTARGNPIPSGEQEQFQQGLADLQRRTGIPPTIKRLDGEVTKVGSMPVEKGGHSQVWQGLWLGQKKVALKVLQGVMATERAEARFENEIRIWAKLKHPNVQPLYGIVANMGPFIHTVSPWQDNGNVLEFVRTTTNAGENVDKARLLLGAARGLAYLHAQRIIHGNVRCANILVTAEREACICDFGMSKVIGEITDTPASATLTTAGSTRWLAPELIFDTSIVSPTVACDTWSFSMSMLECFTMRPPWSDVRRDAHIIQVMEKQSRFPTRPPDTSAPTDAIWNVMVECWHWVPSRRPPMDEVARKLDSCLKGSSESMDYGDLR